MGALPRGAKVDSLTIEELRYHYHRLMEACDVTSEMLQMADAQLTDEQKQKMNRARLLELTLRLVKLL